MSIEHLQQLIDENANTIGPGDELNTAESWSSWLTEFFPTFEGNFETAGLLMASFTEGKKYLLDTLRTRGLTNFVVPAVLLLLQDSATHSPMGSQLDAGCIFVKLSFLQEYSLLDPSVVRTITRADGEHVFTGTMIEFFGLAGVEETHHFIFEQIKNISSPVIDPLQVTVAEYDARENEYRALLWQLRFARKKNMRDSVCIKIRERLEAARIVRSSVSA